MKVAEVMTRAVDLVDPSATVQAAATQMAELDVGAVLVGTAEAIEGILTDRDIIVRVVVEGRNPAEVTVREVMTPDVVACSADDSVEAGLRRDARAADPPHAGARRGRKAGRRRHARRSRQGTSRARRRSPEKLREISEPHRSRKAPEEKPPEQAAEADDGDAAEDGEACDRAGLAAEPDAHRRSRMTLQQGLAFAVVIGMMALFVWGRLRYDLVALLALFVVGAASGSFRPRRRSAASATTSSSSSLRRLLVSAAVARSGIVEVALQRIGPYLTSQRMTIVVLVARSRCSPPS